MDFRQLEAFAKVSELRSFSKAADAIFLSQPSVSLYISALEKELGQPLLNRSTKEVALTHAGKLFLESAKQLLALKENAMAQIRSIEGNFSDKINVLASSVPSQYLLPQIIADFRAIYLKIIFNVRQADTMRVVSGIAAGDAEIGFCGGIIDNEKCDFNEFATEEMVLIAPIGGEIYAPKIYSLAEILYSHPFIGRETGSGTKSEYENFININKINSEKINIVSHFDNTQSIINAVINGLGVAIVSKFAAKTYVDKRLVTQVKLSCELPQRKFYYVLKKGFAPSHLTNLLTSFVSKNRGVADV
ncbi:MAG: selenium metabolism-associated LysR family transcriptional regulator [Defluviitaleaceae bacterium]|nr:selenium metabolism-associated LysR family transcriptional regulator [Defluviitaleaceae bacterium]